MTSTPRGYSEVAALDTSVKIQEFIVWTCPSFIAGPLRHAAAC